MMGTICTYCELGVEDDDVDGAGVCGRCRMRADAAALFVVNDSPVFVGYDTGATWNGWTVPEFDYDETRAILSWLVSLGHVEGVDFDAMNGNLRFTHNGEHVKIVPDAGRYTFDGWTWDTVNFDAWNSESLESLQSRFATVPFTVWDDFAPWIVSVRQALAKNGNGETFPHLTAWVASRAGIESHRDKWAEIALTNGWYTFPFPVQIWVSPSTGEISDSLATRGMVRDVVVWEENDDNN